MIIAVDFDGVLCEDRFPEIGPEYGSATRMVRDLVARGHEVILWTARTGGPMCRALEWCCERGMEFCAVNDNAPSNKAAYSGEYPDPSRKVYADLYLDDHCPFFQYYAGGDRGRAVDLMVEKTMQYVNRYEGIWDIKEENDG